MWVPYRLCEGHDARCARPNDPSRVLSTLSRHPIPLSRGALRRGLHTVLLMSLLFDVQLLYTGCESYRTVVRDRSASSHSCYMATSTRS